MASAGPRLIRIATHNRVAFLEKYPVRAADGSTVYRKIKKSNIVWDFTVTGYHTSGGNRDVECNTLKFRLRLRVGEREPWSFDQEEQRA